MSAAIKIGAVQRWRYASLALLLCGQLLKGQVFTASGGVSTIGNAQGGQLTMTCPAYAFSIGGGESSGRFVDGIRYVKQTARAKYTVGDQYARFDLATDVFDPGHFVDMQGVGVETTVRKTNVVAFVGATSTDMSNPLFSAASADHPAAALLFRSRWNSNWQSTSYNLVSTKLTSIEGVQWRPMAQLALAVSGGVGAGHLYAASSVDFSSPHLDAKAAYIYADSQFQRTLGRSPALAEPDRGNIEVIWKPVSSLTMTGGHQNFLSSPSSGSPGLRTSLDDLSVGATLWGAELNVASFHSTYQGFPTNAIACSASRVVSPRLSVEESYLEAWPASGQPTRTILTNLRETLTPRWSLSELLTQSAGRTTVAFGGSFLSNLASVSIDYQNYYVPSHAQDPFQRALIADVQLRAFGRVTLHGTTFLDPQGHLKYTADAICVLDRQNNKELLAQRILIGGSMLQGEVIDQNGVPIAGAALRLDQSLVYTDSNGRFFLRERRPRIHKLVVMTERFLNEGSYSVAYSPSSLSSGAFERNGTIIVLRREP